MDSLKIVKCIKQKQLSYFSRYNSSGGNFVMLFHMEKSLVEDGKEKVAQKFETLDHHSHNYERCKENKLQKSNKILHNEFNNDEILSKAQVILSVAETPMASQNLSLN